MVSRFRHLAVLCAGCQGKRCKGAKLGKGAVLRCHKARITRMLEARFEAGRLLCPCGAVIGQGEGGALPDGQGGVHGSGGEGDEAVNFHRKAQRSITLKKLTS